MRLAGWGRFPVLDCRLERLREAAELRALAAGSDTLIARGAGRSYGDAALNPDLTLSLLPLDRMQAFDPATGLLTCESGVLLADILQTFVPRGWFPPVVPGTRFVTVGGMIAADVHGKNHHRDGSFGAHVEALTLACADGAIRECSRAAHADLFRATVGGLGLTGVILSARLRLQPVASAFVRQETLPARDLDETLDRFEESREWPFSAAWIDGLAGAARRGRALLTRGRFLERSALPAPAALAWPAAAARRPRVAVDAPAALLNRISVGLFNALRYRRGSAGGVRTVHGERFFFPLDGLEHWNRLYGRRGFVQYQCVLPRGASAAGIAALLDRSAGQGPFLAVMKLLGAAGEGLMSFPMDGHTLSLDFPLRRGTLRLLDELDEITHGCGGRVYLAKDARCAPRRVEEGYPGYAAFRALRQAGALHRYASALSQRLSL